MGPLSDGEIRYRRTLPDGDPLHLRIDPFSVDQVKLLRGERCVGHGLSSFGYDVTLNGRFRVLTTPRRQPGSVVTGDRVFPLPAREPFVIDPLAPAGMYSEEFGPDASGCVLVPPGGCLLAETVERFRIPEDCIGLVTCKSTWARCFLGFNITTLEPGWRGTVTLELANLTECPIRLRVGHGIAQVLFLAGGQLSQKPYNARPEASYQDQEGPTPPRAGPDG